jgi:hypothetical protein
VWQEIDSLIRLDWSQAENLFGSNIYQNPFCIWGLRFLVIGSCFHKLENRKEEKPGASY